MKKAETIARLFGNKLVGTKRMKAFVSETLSRMPQSTIDYITTYCWFFSSSEEAWAFTFTGNDLKDHHLIFLSDELLTQHAGQIRYTIAHEIGHVMLKHRNSVFEKQSKEEIKRQEKEADAFAKQYVSNDIQ